MKRIPASYLRATLALVWLSFATSCSQEEPQQSPAHTPYIQPQYTGAVVRLSMEGSEGLFDQPQMPEGVRAMDYALEGDKAFPKLQLPAAGQKVQVLCIFRKLGDASSTTYATLEWIVQEDGKSLKYSGEVQLANGNFSTQDNGKWYMMGIIGGTSSNIATGQDANSARVSYQSTSLIRPSDNNTKLTADVPYILPWTPLNITRDEYAEHKQLRFKPQGSLVSIQVRNGMVDSYTIKTLRLRSNIVSNTGYFDISRSAIQDIHLQNGTLAPWVASETATAYSLPQERSNYFATDGPSPWASDWWAMSFSSDNTSTNKHYYSSYSYPEALTVASGAVGDRYYAWLMPVSSSSSTATTSFYLESAMGDNGQNIYALPALTSSNALESGKYYRAYPELRSDLIVSELCVHYPIAEGARDSFRAFEGEGDGDWEGDGDGDSPTPPEIEGFTLGFNFSLIELYNPTLDTINLRNYGIIRTTIPKSATPASYSAPKFYRYGEDEGSEDPMQATLLPLSAIATNAIPAGGADYDVFTSTPFATWAGKRANYKSVNTLSTIPIEPRYKVLAGNAPQLEGEKLMLLPGRCIVLASAGYFLPEGKLKPEEQALRQKVLSQLQDAVNKGYCQYVVAFSDGEPITEGFRSDVPYNETGTLDIASGIGVALVRGTKKGFKIVDCTIPYKPAIVGADASKYDQDWAAYIARYSSNGMFGQSTAMGYTRHAGSNHANIRPIYTTGENYYPYTTLWTAVSQDADYSYGRRSSGVSTSSAFVAPALRPWLRK